MKPVCEPQRKEGQKLSGLDLVAEFYTGLQMVAAALIAGLIISFAVYFPKQDRTRLLIGLALMITSFIVGIILATNVWKKKGLPYFERGSKAGPEPSPQSIK